MMIANVPAVNAVWQYEFLSNPAQSVGGTPKTPARSVRRSLHRSSLAASLAKLLHLVELRPRLQASQKLARNCALACSRVAARTPPKSQSV